MHPFVWGLQHSFGYWSFLSRHEPPFSADEFKIHINTTEKRRNMISSNTKVEFSGIRELQILWGVEYPISSPITWPLIRRSTFGPGKQVSWRCSFAACPLAGCLGLSLKVAGTGKAWEEQGDFTNSGTVTGDLQWKVQTVLWALYHQQGAFTNKNGGSNHRNGCVGLCRVICFKDQQRCELKNGLLLLLLLETHHLGRGIHWSTGKVRPNIIFS